MSFILSLFSALLATLVQQWSHTYLADAQCCGPRHVYPCLGVEHFGFSHAVDAIVAILHISVFLFIAGFLFYLFQVNPIVAHSALSTVGVIGFPYIILKLLPLASLSCPYGTPLTIDVHLILAPLIFVAQKAM